MMHGIAIVLVCFTSTARAFFDAYAAQQLYQAGDTAAAQARYQDMVAADFTNWRALYNLGTIALNEKQYEQAVHDFEKVVALKPDNKQAHERLAIARKLRDEEQQQQKKEDEQKNQDQDQQDKKENEQEQQDQNQQDRSDAQDDAQENSRDSKRTHDQDKRTQKDDANKEEKSEQDKQAQEKNEQREQEEKKQSQQKQIDAENKAAQEKQKKAEEAAKAARDAAAAQQKEQDAHLSKRELYLLKELDKVDQQVQKEMIQYAVSHAQEGAEKHGSRKNW